MLGPEFPSSPSSWGNSPGRVLTDAEGCSRSADRRRTRGFEAADAVTGAVVAGKLLVGVADEADLPLLGEELRRAPIEVHVDAVLVLRVGILIKL